MACSGRINTVYTGKTKVHSGEFRDEFRESTSK